MRTNTGAAKQRWTAFLAVCFMLLAGTAQAQTDAGTIAGTVTDSTTGAPLPGVNVVIQGTQQGASTGGDGTYTIPSVDPGTYTLQASFVGYNTKSVTGVQVAAGDTVQVDFTLAPSTVGLEEVVVVGYGTQEREDLTGSVSSVEGEQISRIPTPSATQALQGQVAGVQVTPSSGEPGAGAVVRIRGVGTLGDASPLYVVDGMLTDDITFLNPQDIQSVDVLKDASATAIYGSRGANGVIIVTTQQGSRGQETRFNFNAYYGQQEVANPIDLVNAQQYAVLANELAANQETPLPFENPQSVSQNTDWQDVAFRPAPIQSYQLSAVGGTERVSYSFSGNYISEGGVVENSDFERASLRLNNNYQLSDPIELGHNIAFTYARGVDAPGVISSVYRADPTIAPRDAEGNFNDAGLRASAGNPAASLFYHRNKYNSRRLVGNVFLNVDFLQDFTFQTSFGVDLKARETQNFNPTFFVSPEQQNEEASVSVVNIEDQSWLWENTINYQRTFGDHAIDAVTGLTAQEFRGEFISGQRIVPIGESESLWYLGVGQEDGQENDGGAEDWRLFSALFRVNYDYLGRYLFTVTGRADGSSRFRDGNRFGYFPSFAAGWRVSEEPFMEGVDAISNLKLRASWGIIGNQKIGPYPGIPLVSGNLNAVFGRDGSLAFGATPAELANPAIRWEETRQTDLALEMGFFDDRLTAEVDYYNRLTDGILIQVPIPDYVGVNAEPTVNAAEVRNTGFDLNLSFNGAAGDFDYRIGLLGSTVSNEVESLGGGREEILGGGLVNEIAFTTKTLPGQPIGSFFGYKVAGIYQSEEQIQNLPSSPTENLAPGDFRFEDINGDGEITPDDRTFIGSPIPDFNYGINLGLSWKGLDLAVDLTGQSGNEIFNAKKGVRFGIENFEESFLDRWTGPNTSTSEPRLTSAGWNYQASDWYLSDGSYFKLRNVQLGYALPQDWVGSLQMQRARIYVNGNNLFTVTDYSGYTPEISGIPRGSEARGNRSISVLENGIDTGLYPTTRSFTVGVNVTF